MLDLATKESRLRKKHTIGDWFLVTAMVLLGLMALADLLGDNVLGKAVTAVSKMISKVK